MKKVLTSLALAILVITLTGCTDAEMAKYNQLKTEHPELAQKYIEKYGEPTPDVTENEIQVEVAPSEEPVKRTATLSKVAEETAQPEEVEVAEEVKEEVKEEIKAPEYSDLVVGDVVAGNVVTFGRYEQDGDEANGPEAVEWIVLEVADGKATLLPTTCMMGGGDFDADTMSPEFYKTAFTDDEKAVISEFHNLITSDFLAKYAGGGGYTYNQDSRFSCLTTYSEKLSSIGYGPLSGTHPDGTYQSSYYFWTEGYRSRWIDTTQGIHKIEELTHKPRGASQSYGGINPYIVIYTEDNMQ